jgi:hypothetical protein
MRRHNISDWNVWYGAFGKSDYAKQMGNFIAFRGLIYLSIILPFQLCVVLPFKIFLWLAENALMDAAQKRIEETKESNRGANIYNEIIGLIPRVEVQSSKSIRKKYAHKIIELLSSLESIGRSHFFSNFEELREQMKVVLKTADAIDYLDKADKQYFLNKKKMEIKYLLEAIYSLRIMKVTIQEFNSLHAKSELTGQTWTVNYIKSRLLDAGYTPTK